MTMINAGETERIPGRRNDRLWDLIQRDWAGDNPRRWKQLACLHLRLHCRWQLEMIGRAFGHSRGHILRMINASLTDLQTSYAGDRHDGLRRADDLPPQHHLAPSTAELDRRIDCCRQELDVWQRLRERQTHANLWDTSDERPQITPGSLRERIAQCLEDDRPRRSTQIALELRTAPHQVRCVLWECPEFVSDDDGVWSLHRFEGQESLGIDVEPSTPTQTSEGDDA